MLLVCPPCTFLLGWLLSPSSGIVPDSAWPWPCGMESLFVSAKSEFFLQGILAPHKMESGSMLQLLTNDYRHSLLATDYFFALFFKKLYLAFYCLKLGVLFNKLKENQLKLLLCDIISILEAQCAKNRAGVTHFYLHQLATLPSPLIACTPPSTAHSSPPWGAHILPCLLWEPLLIWLWHHNGGTTRGLLWYEFVCRPDMARE